MNNINDRNNRNNPPPCVGHGGFTLLEVLIAVTLFAIFVTAIVTTQGYNVADSASMKKELVLQKLCENKINEILLNPPVFEEGLTLLPKTGNFAEQGYPEYQYSIEYRRLKIPDVSKIMGTDERDEGESGGENSKTTTGDGSGEVSGDGRADAGASENGASTEAGTKSSDKGLEKKIFSLIKKNMEEMIWQVKVTVKETATDFPFSLSTFVTNRKAKIKVEL